LRLLFRLWRIQQASPNGIKIDSRQLAKDCNIGRCGIYSAIKHLVELNHLTHRPGDTRNASIYRVCAFDTVAISGLKTRPLNPRQWSENQTTVDLFSDHSGLETRPLPPDSKGLPAAAAPLDFDSASLRLIDRVYSSKPQDHDKAELATLRRILHGYYAKFGRDERGQALKAPHAPQDDVTAKVLAVADLHRIETMMDNLTLDAINAGAHQPGTNAALNPQHYIWFVTIALSRVHGIHFSVTKKLRAQLRDVKRRPTPEPEQIALPDIGDLARKKSMR
jgi:hypothetical protein